MTRIVLVLAASLVVAGGVAEAQSGKKGSGQAPVGDAPACGAVAFQDGAMTCACPANGSNGSVWGSGPYTADSDICTAARHAGVIVADGGIVRLQERPGQGSYTGTNVNGVSTSDWGSYGQSFSFVGATPVASTLAACAVIPDGAEEHSCNCPANPPQRSVWGSSPYTADSDICSAAVHSGFVDASVGGDVVLLRVPGLAMYRGEESYGVTSSDWGSYESSIIFDWNR